MTTASQTIYKYPISLSSDVRVKIPLAALIVQVGLDGEGVPCVWALCNPDEIIKQERQFGIYGTGGRVPLFWTYVGTFHDLPAVWHVFENTRG